MPHQTDTDQPRHGQHPEQSVRQRYSAAAQQRERALCCPVDYDRRYLEVIPEEILQRDYGCGDPSRFVAAGETVLDLGSGGGKICYIAAQVVGPEGRVIGVDCNAEMLALARRYQPQVAERVGYDVVEFKNGLIQDLALDLDLLADKLKDQPVGDTAGWLRLRDIEHQLRQSQPMIADATVDCVVSNCVLNLVRPADRRQLFGEIFRVLKPGGRAAISDIVADRDVPAHLQADPELWSGCLSGAYREDTFLQAFAEAGFQGLKTVARQPQPWQVVEQIAFRSVTVLAYKPLEQGENGRQQRVLYLGPFQQIIVDGGQTFRRGEPATVAAATAGQLTQPPYSGAFALLDDQGSTSAGDSAPVRSLTTLSGSDASGCCTPDGGCC